MDFFVGQFLSVEKKMDCSRVDVLCLLKCQRKKFKFFELYKKTIAIRESSKLENIHWT